MPAVAVARRNALVVELDAPLPAELAVGSGTAVFVGGTCVPRSGRIHDLTLVVDGREQPLMAHGMPRLGHRDALGAPEAYRSGFWGFARVTRGGAPAQLGLRARLAGGGDAVAELARIPPAAVEEPLAPEPPGGGPLVAICMATHQPPPDLLARQLESIRAQTHRNWVCVISDDASDPERFAALEAQVAGDPRFAVSRSPRRLGFYRNFERALAHAPATAQYVALADQDDLWHRDKVATLLAELGGARLVYSDMRVAQPGGELIADTYWDRRSNNHEDMLSLLVTNSVTGAAALFPRDLLDDALPFPPAQFAHFHDHWIALCALATGDIRYVDRPLYDYIQHGGAVVGHERANRMPGLRERLPSLWRDPRERVRVWRMHYFGDACRLIQFATTLELRCGERMSAPKRRVLERFARGDSSVLPVARLGLRGARELLGRRRETLGGEWMLMHAFAWRHLLDATVRDEPRGRLRLDAVPPPMPDPNPGVRAGEEPRLRALQEKVEPLALAVREDAPRRVNLLIPTIDLRHFFGGYIAKLALAKRLAARGLRVRMVTVDPTGPLGPSWRRQVESYPGLAGVFDAVEVAFGREHGALEVSPADAFVATTWWTAHVADAALASVEAGRFLYLIQEYEPFTFPMSSLEALARASYRLPHVALFSTELLRGYFRRHAIGVYARGAEAGDAASAAFRNAITAVAPPSAGELAGRAGRRLLFYARPEAHAARNLFELGALALGRARERGALDGWTLHGIGTVEGARRLDLGGATALELLPRVAQGEYAQLLRAHDAGLALMYTPHPSLVPIEMASAGMLTVTNSFENKTADALAAISRNLVVAEPDVESIASAICAATAGAGDVERRAAGARVDWPSDWDEALDDALMARVAAWLSR
jgi:hypothetical protein